jgi:hypothetical protein
MPVIEQHATNTGPLDNDFVSSEITKAINKLHRGKSAGLDLITNEMFKCASDLLIKPIEYVFNTALKTGIYPETWTTGIIVPIHKSGDKTDTNNYRGIAISSCLSKLFNSILNSRLENYMVENNLWKRNQSGFMKKHRTEDNLFVFQAIQHKYVQKTGQKIYAAFVDFQKFFDTINRTYLYYKLLGLNITGKFYSLIKTMYDTCEYCVKTSDGLSKTFRSDSGVKQGCNLSPTLANLFQNDLHDIFKNDCDPVSLDGLEFNSMSWADDLVLFSTSPKGLQTCLDRLQSYCFKWGLQVNTKKTKCMVLRKSLNCKVYETFNITDSTLETVDKFTYLGIEMTATGNVGPAIQARVTKAMRAVNMCRQAITTTGNVSTVLALSIFDKQIQPILTYGCPIWGLPHQFTNHIYLDNLPPGETNTVQARTIVRDICKNNVKIDLVRKTKAPPDSSGGSVILKFNSSNDKDIFIQNVSTYTGNISYRDVDWDYDRLPYEKVQTNYCKFALNVSKYAGNEACRGELGRYPLCHKIWTLAIKYWLRMEHGSPNLFLNKAYQCVKTENHQWVQSIKCLLYRNGFGYVWENPHCVQIKSFGRIFQARLDAQYEQKWYEKISSSNRYEELSFLNDRYEIRSYLQTVENIEIRNTFTRLRCDMNKLQMCVGRTQNIPREKRICPLCNTGTETVEHFLLDCQAYDNDRQEFIRDMSSTDRLFIHRNNREKLRIVLNVHPQVEPDSYDKSIKFICKYVKTAYAHRVNHQQNNC